MTKAAALPRRESNKVRTRGAILRAAVAKFGEKGIGDTTMDEIAEQAEVSRATLFNYFPSKTDIVAAVVEQMDDAFIAQVEASAALDLPGAGRIEHLFRTSGRDMENRWREFRPLVGVSAQGWGDEIGGRRFARIRQAFALLVSDVAEEDRMTYAEILAGTYVNIVHHWRFDSDYALEERLLAAARIIAKSLQDTDM
jgi:AcrR family transcriptional regulator